MLQTVAHNPPQMSSAIGSVHYNALREATSIINAEVCPVAEEADLIGTLLYMKHENDIRGAIALYDAFVAMADATMLVINQPRCSDRSFDYLNGEWERHIAKAYLVADSLRQMDPDFGDLEAWTEALISCAFRMGENIEEIAKIAVEAGKLSKHRRSRPDVIPMSEPR